MEESVSLGRQACRRRRRVLTKRKTHSTRERFALHGFDAGAAGSIARVRAALLGITNMNNS